MRRSVRLALAALAAAVLVGSGLPAAAAPADVVLDCSSVRWQALPGHWTEVRGIMTASSQAKGIRLAAIGADFTVGTTIATDRRPYEFFESFPLADGSTSLAISATYTVAGQTRSSNTCVIDGITKLEWFQPGFLSGPDRYATSVAVAAAAFPERADAVFVASGEDFPDALSAGPAAAHLDAPLLLTRRGAVPAEVVAKIRALGPRVIYVVGGEGAVSSAAFGTLSALAPDIHRLSGPDRYATSLAVSRGIFSGFSRALVASGETFADAVSAGAAAAAADGPVLLVAPGAAAPPAELLAHLADMRVQEIAVVGGPSAVSAAMEGALRASFATLRLGGPDRYETSALVNGHFFGPAADHAYLTVGTDFPDALSGTTIAARTGSPLLVTRPICIVDGPYRLLAQWGVSGVDIIGGSAATRGELSMMRSCLEVDFFGSHRW